MRTRTRTILAGLVLVAALGGGAAWATIPGANGTIQGCYTTGNGNLRVVDSADECRNSETAISWNQQGQKGEPGAAGASGANGAAGSNGAPGAKGDPCLATDPACIGPKGDTGAAGANGTNGADGAAGSNGTNGAPGAKGDSCLATDPACIGPKGDTGAAGASGTNGTNGVDGRDGARGDACLPDLPGCRGLKGDNGEPGEPGADGAPCLPTNPACVGPQGPAGSSGSGGFLPTVAALPVQSTPGPPVLTQISTSPDWGTLEASCQATGGTGPRTLIVYLFDTKSGAGLYYVGTSSFRRVLPRPTGHPGGSSIWGLEGSSADADSHDPTRYTLLRFGKETVGKKSLTQRVFVAAGEILSDGRCEVTIWQGAA